MKVKEYHKIIKEIYNIDLEADSIADSRRILAELNEKEILLKELKKSIQKDIKRAELGFLEKRRKVNVDYAGGRSPVMSRVRGKSKVKELKKLEREHDKSVESYGDIKYMVDDLLIQIQEAKEQLNKYIKKKLFGV